MVLSDSEIKIRVTKDKLLELHDPGKIKYCGYEMCPHNKWCSTW